MNTSKPEYSTTTFLTIDGSTLEIMSFYWQICITVLNGKSSAQNAGRNTTALTRRTFPPTSPWCASWRSTLRAYGGDPGDVMTGPPQMQKCQVSPARANPIRILQLRTNHLLMPTYIN